MGGPTCAAIHVAAAYEVQHDAVVSRIQVFGIGVESVFAAANPAVLDAEHSHTLGSAEVG